MAPDPNLVDQAARWVESFLRSNGCSEPDVSMAKNCIVQQKIDGAVLLSMSAIEIQNVLHLTFGDAKKLEQDWEVPKVLIYHSCFHASQPKRIDLVNIQAKHRQIWIDVTVFAWFLDSCTPKYSTASKATHVHH